MISSKRLLRGIRSAVAAVSLAALMSVNANAQDLGFGIWKKVPAAGSSFVGIVDKETTAVDFWGLVAADAAVASAGHVAVDLSNNSTSCTGVKLLSTGYLDVSVGIYCTGSLTVAGWCAATAGSCAISAGDTVARITKMYDEIGTTDAPFSYATAPGFIVAATSSQWSGSKPIGFCVASRSVTGTAAIAQINSPFSLGFTGERVGNFSSFSAMLSDSGAGPYLGNPNVANDAFGQIFGVTSSVNVTMADGTGTTDFSHFGRALYAVPAAAGNATLYTGDTAGAHSGTDATSASSVLAPPGDPITPCGYTGNNAQGFFSAFWVDNTQVAATPAGQITNFATVPLP